MQQNATAATIDNQMPG